VDKAEADFLSAGREYRARKRPNYDPACFFAQQCVEKYLKARLVEASLSFPRTHDLEALLEIVLRVEPFWEELRAALTGLTSYAVAFRYPGDSATRAMARTALQDASLARGRIRGGMGLRI
jgi:HEPN domain-containing protein